MDAVVEILTEVGFRGLTIDAVAQRAGVGKASIYRRWPGKEQLVLDALTAEREQLGDVEPASLEEQAACWASQPVPLEELRAGERIQALEAVYVGRIVLEQVRVVCQPRRHEAAREGTGRVARDVPLAGLVVDVPEHLARLGAVLRAGVEPRCPAFEDPIVALAARVRRAADSDRDPRR